MSRIGNVGRVLLFACAWGAACDVSSPGQSELPMAQLDASLPESKCAPEPNLVGPGAACRCDTDCVGGAQCVPEDPAGFPGNACLVFCRPGEDDCPPRTFCAPYVPEKQTSYCAPICARSSDCGPGRRCAGNLCLPACTRDEQCLSGHCIAERGTCAKESEEHKGGLLASCLRHEQCRSGFCSTDAGRCLTFCSVDGPACPNGSICLSTRGSDLSTRVQDERRLRWSGLPAVDGGSAHVHSVSRVGLRDTAGATQHDRRTVRVCR